MSKRRAPDAARLPRANGPSGGQSGDAQSGAAPLRPIVTRLLRVRTMDPRATSGPETTVLELFRLEERIAGGVRPHLVYHDREGWRCVHGPDCPAVRWISSCRRSEATDERGMAVPATPAGEEVRE